MQYQVFTEKNFKEIAKLKNIDTKIIDSIYSVGSVLPFRVNNYVIDNLIDWSNIPNDPMFQLTFPQREMLAPSDLKLVEEAIACGPSAKKRIRGVADQIRDQLNPQPGDQKTKNIPTLDDQLLPGIQHKYKNTILFFPSQGQTCHAYCTFCFRWAQFIGNKDLRFASNNIQQLTDYLRSDQQITDIIFTGGDPLFAKTKYLSDYLDAMLDPSLEHVQNIRIGTKAISYWPYRFLTDPDADDLLRLFEKMIKRGKHIAIMAHLNHWRELEPEISKKAIKRLLSTGVIIRSQGPLLAHINDSPSVWSKMWHEQVKLNIIPYYMFVERDTGANRYFKIPLERCWDIYREAINGVSGLCRTARGPSMSTSPGKIEIQGVTHIAGEKVFVLRFLQARDTDWVQRPFFAKYDPNASWLDDLVPAFGEKTFFFENQLQ